MTTYPTMHCPDCGHEYEMNADKGITCAECGGTLKPGSRDGLTNDGRTLESIIASYAEGAEKVLKQLRDWTIGADEAHQLERSARAMFYEDTDNLGISRKKAKEIWEDKIFYPILAQDIAFDR